MTDKKPEKKLLAEQEYEVVKYFKGNEPGSRVKMLPRLAQALVAGGILEEIKKVPTRKNKAAETKEEA